MLWQHVLYRNAYPRAEMLTRKSTIVPTKAACALEIHHVLASHAIEGHLNLLIQSVLWASL